MFTTADLQKARIDAWTANTLKRTSKLGKDVYERAKSRKVDWPRLKHQKMNTQQDPLVYTSLDDAFSSVLQFMSVTTRQCKRYYRSSASHVSSSEDEHHCNRFHTPLYSPKRIKNPLQRTEDVHIVVPPGSYSITAGSRSSTEQQSHVIHIQEGQSIDLDFNV